MEAVWLGEVGYREALDFQFDHVDRRATAVSTPWRVRT